MKKYKKILLLTLISLLLIGCESNQAISNEQVKNIVINNNEVVEDVVDDDLVEEISYQGYSFLSKEEAVEVLSTEDDYLIKLSQFDYASKFFSDKPLDKAGLQEAYNKTVFEWSDEQKKVISDTMVSIQEDMAHLDIDMPDVSFVLTARSDEGGAAYTRGVSIILKSYHVGSVPSQGLKELIIHEMFHVYSRENKDMRQAMYEVIGYKPCEELIVPDELKDLMISNPDAPDNNFYIEGDYNGETYAFIPIIFSSEAYEIGSGRSFFETLRDDMLAVEIVDGIANPVRIDGDLLIVKKDHIDGFYDKIGMNTDYTYHPEETMADNFVFLVLASDVKSPWVVEGLKEVISR